MIHGHLKEDAFGFKDEFEDFKKCIHGVELYTYIDRMRPQPSEMDPQCGDKRRDDACVIAICRDWYHSLHPVSYDQPKDKKKGKSDGNDGDGFDKLDNTTSPAGKKQPKKKRGIELFMEEMQKEVYFAFISVHLYL